MPAFWRVQMLMNSSSACSVLVALLTILAGCQTQPSAPAPIARETSIIHFDDAFASQISEHHSVYRESVTDNMTYIDEFAGIDVFGFIIASLTRPGFVVQYRPVDRVIQELLQHEMNFESSRTVQTPFGLAEYRLFEVQEDKRHCVGFSAMSGIEYGDAGERPRNFVYGYFCRQDLQPIAEPDAERLIGYVAVDNHH